MVWRIELTEDAKHALAKLDKPVARRITAFLKVRVASLDDPRSVGQALRGSKLGDFWKYRVGDYRVVCSIDDGVVQIVVIKIGHRGDVYR